MTIGISTPAPSPDPIFNAKVVRTKKGPFSTELARLTVNPGSYIITASSGVSYPMGYSAQAELVYGFSLTLRRHTIIYYGALWPPHTLEMANMGQSIAAITMGAVTERRSSILLLGTVNARLPVDFFNPMITAIKVDELSFGSARSNVFQDWHPELVAKVLRTLRSKYKLDYPDKEA